MASVAEEIAALRGTRTTTLRDLLTQPPFSRLWPAMLVSSLGDWVGFVAVASLVARLGRSPSLAALATTGVILARLLPSLLFGAFAGVVVDRFDRRKVMIGADIGRGLLYASMPFLPELWLIFVVSFAVECLSLVWTPAKDASVPNLVPRRQLANANSVGLITTYGSLPLGAIVFTALAGIATAFGAGSYLGERPEALALWLDAGTFFFSARMIWGLDLRQGPVAGRRAAPPGHEAGGEALSMTGAVSDIREGFRFLREHPLVRTLTLGILVAFAGAGSVISLGPTFARYTVSGARATGFGILMTALGLGMAAGMGLASKLQSRLDKGLLFGLSIEGAAISLFVIAAMPSIWLAALLVLPGGAGAGLAWVTGYTMLQENVTDRLRGRTFATLNVTVRMALFLSLLVFPAVAAAIGNHAARIAGVRIPFTGVRIALWLGGAALLFAGAASRRGLRRQRIHGAKPLALAPKFARADGGGLFIAFEGVEGAGKGTQIELARAHVESRGHEVIVTREPGGTALGDRLRDAVLDPAAGEVDPRAEALLFAAGRAQHVVDVIRPALAEGKVVLCDRYVDSSVAYQGSGRGLGEQDVLTLNAWATQGLFPDLTILLDLDPAAGLERAGGTDRIEAEDPDFHRRVADAYLRIAEEHPDRVAVIDATGTVEEVHARVVEAIDRVLVRAEEGRAGAT